MTMRERKPNIQYNSYCSEGDPEDHLGGDGDGMREGGARY